MSSGIISLFIGTLAKLGADLDITGSKKARIAFQESFKRALQDIQSNTLRSIHARKDYASYMGENVLLGQQASSLAKSRIGVAGTAPVSFQTIMERFDRQRDGFRLETQEALAKLMTQKKSSFSAQEKGFDYGNAIFGGLSTLAEFMNSLAQINQGENSGGPMTPTGPSEKWSF